MILLLDLQAEQRNFCIVKHMHMCTHTHIRNHWRFRTQYYEMSQTSSTCITVGFWIPLTWHSWATLFVWSNFGKQQRNNDGFLERPAGVCQGTMKNVESLTPASTTYWEYFKAYFNHTLSIFHWTFSPYIMGELSLAGCTSVHMTPCFN